MNIIYSFHFSINIHMCEPKIWPFTLLAPIKWYHLHSIHQYISLKEEWGREMESHNSPTYVGLYAIYNNYKVHIKHNLYLMLRERDFSRSLHNALVCDALCNVSWSECVASVSVCHPSHYLTRCLFWGDLIRITHTRLNFHTLLTRRVQRHCVHYTLPSITMCLLRPGRVGALRGW